MIELRAHGRRVAAIAVRDVRSEGRQPLRYVIRLVQVVITGVIVYNVSKLIVDSPELAGFGGSYFDFAMIGLAVMSVAHLGITTFNDNILREQQLGTMEVVLSTPTPISVLLTGSFAFPLLLTVVDLVLYLGGGVGIFGGGLRPIGVVFAIPLLALTLASFCAFGILGASLVVLIKRGDPLTAPLTLLTSILSGALFPVSTFPVAVELLARAFPAYYGISGLREALLTSAGWREIGPDVVVLVGFDIVMLPVAVAIFQRALAVARETGTLANY